MINLIEIGSILVSVLSMLVAILAHISKIRWAKEFAVAKDEIIRAREAETEAKAEQLQTKDELIRIKDIQIKHWQSLTPEKVIEYHNSVKAELYAYNETLRSELESSKQELKATLEKQEKLEKTIPSNEIIKREIARLKSEKIKHEKIVSLLEQQSRLLSRSRISIEYKPKHPLGISNTDTEGLNIKDLLRILSVKTGYLWQGIVELKSDDNALQEEIKESTFTEITDVLTLLRIAGLLDFDVDKNYKTLPEGERVYFIKFWNIATVIKNIAQRIEKGDI